MKVSTSFVQDQKHLTKSNKFVVVQPSAIAEVLQDHGFHLIGLKSGKGRKADRLDFQTTVARYRSNDNFMSDAGLSMDLMWRIPHLTGAMEGRLGFFRGTCANQWNMGSLFEVVKLSHTGNVLTELDAAIPRLVAQRQELIETIKMMQARNVSAPELAQLAQGVSDIRLQGIAAPTKVMAQDLLVPRRIEDRAADLFTVTNVLQENAIRFGMRYQTSSMVTVNQGLNRTPYEREVTRNMTTRRINENSERAIDLNASIWDLASNLLKTA